MTTTNVPVKNEAEVKQSKAVDSTRSTQARRRVVVPEYRIEPKDNSVDIIAVMPGVAEDGVDIRLESNWLTVQGSANEPDLEGFTKVYGEFTTVDYEAGFKLPNHFDADGINAMFRNGLLTITVPKAKESLPRSIAVNAG